MNVVANILQLTHFPERQTHSFIDLHIINSYPIHFMGTAFKSCNITYNIVP